MPTVSVSPRARRLARDPDDDVDTVYYSPPPRQPPPAATVTPRHHPWDRAASAAGHAKEVWSRRKPAELSPPSVTPERARRAVTLVRTSKPRAKRSVMPWVTFLTCFGIAFGVARDGALRAQLASQLTATTSHAAAVIVTTMSGRAP